MGKGLHFLLSSFVLTTALIINFSDAFAKIPVECPDILVGLNQHQISQQVAKYIVDLHETLQSTRISNGAYKTRGALERARRLQFIRQQLSQGQVTVVASMYRSLITKVEMAYYTILHHVPAISALKELDTIDSRGNTQLVEKHLPVLEEELAEAYKDLGENFIEYSVTRSVLEEMIKDETTPSLTKFSAEQVLRQLSHAEISRRLPDLNIDPSVRPPMKRVNAHDRPGISDVFKEQAEPAIAFLKKELADQKSMARSRRFYWAFGALETALSVAGRLHIGKYEIGGPRLQKFLYPLFLISRDRLLLTEFLDDVENVLQARDDSTRIKIFMDQCNSRCDEFLETFARLGYLTEDWIHMRGLIETKIGSAEQYAGVFARMQKAETTARNSGGLSLNYNGLSDTRFEQTLLSSGALGLWTLILTTTPAEVQSAFMQIASYLQSLW